MIQVHLLMCTGEQQEPQAAGVSAAAAIDMSNPLLDGFADVSDAPFATTVGLSYGGNLIGCGFSHIEGCYLLRLCTCEWGLTG